VTYDPSKLSFASLLAVYRGLLQQSNSTQSVTATSTGSTPQYRPLVVCTTHEQYTLAVQSDIGTAEVLLCDGIAEAGTQHAATTFWPAEAEHQSMFEHQPACQYSLQVIRPRLLWLEREHGALLLRPDDGTVTATASAEVDTTGVSVM
jgi:peptide methionine sulfoxide reductase MsrA